jgi:hypothetical protein
MATAAAQYKDFGNLADSLKENFTFICSAVVLLNFFVK